MLLRRPQLLQRKRDQLTQRPSRRGGWRGDLASFMRHVQTDPRFRYRTREEMLADLDERGIIRIGAEVQPGDILVGKVTPKGETELTAEERLLRAIFGEKAREVKDSSLRLPHGERGKVVELPKGEGDVVKAGDLLARGEISKKLTVRVHAFSAQAKEKIEAAGGTAELIQAPPGDARARDSATRFR